MKSGRRAGMGGCGGSKRGVGVLGVLTAFAMRNTDRFDAGTLHQRNGTLAHMGEHPPCKRERSVQLR